MRNRKPDAKPESVRQIADLQCFEMKIEPGQPIESGNFRPSRRASFPAQYHIGNTLRNPLRPHRQLRPSPARCRPVLPPQGNPIGHGPVRVAVSLFDITLTHRHDPLIKSLRVALARITEREKLLPGDPVLQELQRSIVRTITELELRRDSESDAA